MKFSLRIFTTGLLLALFQFFQISDASAQGKPQPKPAENDFAGLWPKVDSLSGIGQPRSALKVVEEIYTRAKAGKNDPQLIKCLIYRFRLNSDFSENSLAESIREMEHEAETAKGAVKRVMQSLLAEMYRQYYAANEYRFSDRTRTATVLSDSLETWDLSTLWHAILRNYLLSVENPDSLKKIPVSRFRAILDCDLTGERKKEEEIALAEKFRPTLYDFLAGRALDFLTSRETPKTLPAGRFEVDQEWFLSPTSNFAGNRMMIPGDSGSTASFALRIFRDLATFHMQDRERAALVGIELQRLEFVHENALFDAKDSLYVSVLKQFYQSEISSPWSASIAFSLATFLEEEGRRYLPLVSDRYKWRMKEAAEICDEAVKMHPGSDGAKNCEQLGKNLRSPRMNITTEKAIVPGKPFLAMVRSQNIKELFFRVVITDPEQYADRLGNSSNEEILAFLTGLPAAGSWNLIVPNDGDLQSHSFESAMQPVPEGFYVLLVSTDETFNRKEAVTSHTPFWSTNISYIDRRNETGGIDYFLLDRVTGLPVKEAVVEAWTRRYEYSQRKHVAGKTGDFASDGNGFLSIPSADDGRGNNQVFLKIRHGRDYYVTDPFYLYRSAPPVERPYVETRFFTDRAVYRPGQTVSFKGIVLERTGDRSVIKSGHTAKVTFTDANGRKVAEQTMVSNTFGSFSGSFTAPQDVLPGVMTIFSESGSVQFRVEYYKLPTYEVLFDPLEGSNRLGEQITLRAKAKAYAGNAIDGATVTYRVTRSARFPWRDRFGYWPMPSSPEVEIALGTTLTDSAGAFSITFRALPDRLTDPATKPVFDFLIRADVTDLNGETRSVEETVSVGYQSLFVDAGIPGLVNLQNDTTAKVTTVNLNGRPLPVAVQVTLSKLRDPGRLFRERRWERPDRELMSREEFYRTFPYDIYAGDNDPANWTVVKEVFSLTINTATDSLVRLQGTTGTLEPGAYCMVLKATGAFGETVETRKYFTAYNPGSKEVPVNATGWFVPLKTSGEPGGEARFLVGSKEENVHLLYEVCRQDTVISREWLKISDRVLDVRLPLTDRFRGNVSVNFVFVRHNQVFQESRVVTVPYSNRKLDIRLETFRDRMEPGSKEEWKIRIAGPKGNPASAELMAAMYDQSLDVFQPNVWSFDLFRRFTGLSPWDSDHSFRQAYGITMAPGYYGEGYRSFPELRMNWFGFGFMQGYGRPGKYRRGGVDKVMAMETSAEAGEAALPPAARQDALPGDEKLNSTVPANGEEQASGIPTPKAPQNEKPIRRDFRETAFFYPSLTTDSTGSISLRFTAPESLTRWKFTGLAHTRELEYALLEKELVTRKELMVFPNAPRFVRQGDTLVFSAKVVSMADHDLSGTIGLNLSDALTMKPVTARAETGGDAEGRVAFTLKAGQSMAFSWRVIIPSTPDFVLLKYSVSASAGSFSDGEERLLPVLSNRMMVTETLPLPVRGAGSSTFSLEKLVRSGKQEGSSSTMKNFRLTLEFASNPAWYAIQALPSLDERSHESADAVFAAFWSNSVASHIANSDPAINAVFEAWKNHTPSALASNLEKNQELKSALLPETPWVVAAENESQQKRRIGMYFDRNRVEQNLASNARKLFRLQTPNGGWTWMPGMPENRYITQSVVEGFGKLYHLGIIKPATDPETAAMLLRALQYLEQQLVRDLQEIKKYDPKWMENNHLSTLQVQYLYATSFFTPAMVTTNRPKDFLEAFNYFRTQAEKYWMQHERFAQGMIALALHRLGDLKTPALILKSLEERSLRSAEMGMYWAQTQGGYWYQAPIETQAMMIEAFGEVAGRQDLVEEMQVWLLKQKQTQMWRSTRATLEACYALLLRGTGDLLAPSGQADGLGDISISLGPVKVDPNRQKDLKKEPGTGYFQVSWSGEEISPEMGKVTVRKTNKGVAWGALYWQYFEDTDRITRAGTPLKLEKHVFVGKNTPAGPVLEECGIGQDTAKMLRVGDKLVVRIVLSVDRNLEFVHMKDMRAAALEPLLITSAGNPGRGMPQPYGGGENTLSGFRYQDGLGYYQSTTDVSTNFYFDYLPKGTYVFEYGLRVSAAGDYSNGIAAIQCLYAPEFSAHSDGIRIGVE